VWYPGAAPPVTARAIIEALESLPSRPWPARYRAELRDGRLLLTVSQELVDDHGAGAVRAHLADRGLDVELRTVRLDDPRTLRLVRADLMETTFATPVPVGV
jgi:phenylacetate-CoA ligase